MNWSNHTVIDCTTHGAAITIKFWPAGQTMCSCSAESAKSYQARTLDIQRKLIQFRYSSLLASGSYAMPFLIVSRTIGVFLSRKSGVTDHHISRQRSPHNVYLQKKLYAASFQTYSHQRRNRYTDRYTHKTTTVTLVHARRGLIIILVHIRNDQLVYHYCMILVP